MTQAVKLLLSKCEPCAQIPVPQKKKKKKEILAISSPILWESGGGDLYSQGTTGLSFRVSQFCG
jgi:hypothetical protein